MTLLNSCIHSSHSFYRLSLYIMMQSVNKHSFTFCFHIVIILKNVFFLLYCISEDCSKIWSKSVKSGHLCLVSYIKWKHLMFYLSSYRFIASIPSCYGFLSWMGAKFCQMFFSAPTEMIIWLMLIWWITLTDVLILNQLWISVLNSI